MNRAGQCCVVFFANVRVLTEDLSKHDEASGRGDLRSRLLGTLVAERPSALGARLEASAEADVSAGLAPLCEEAGLELGNYSEASNDSEEDVLEWGCALDG